MKRSRSFMLTIPVMILVNCLALPSQAQEVAAPGLVGGFGSANFIPVWTTGTKLGISAMFQSAGSIGIGTTTPASKLDVVGDINLNGSLRYQGTPVMQVSVPRSNITLGLGSLHVNLTGSANTATGISSLLSNLTGSDNTANGTNALLNNTAGDNNTASGAFALAGNSLGHDNTAGGFSALFKNTIGVNNVALGSQALGNNLIGSNNLAVGTGALGQNTIGNSNIAIGGGGNLTIGNNNIDVGAPGVAGESATIRLGTASQTRAFVAGIWGITTGNADAVPVMIDSSGQLGTVSSSGRFKEDVHDMSESSRGLMRLRPVTFRYKQPFTDGSKPIQYGLIAEEVAEVYPDLVAHSADGQIETVKYQVLDSMLLNEVQRLSKENQDLQQRLARLEAALGNMASSPAAR